jgi:predicted TIM-barrel fold metal-dependent hydrolase
MMIACTFLRDANMRRQPPTTIREKPMLDEYPHNETAEAYDSTIRGLVYPKDRKPQQRGGFELPADTTVVSVDNHWSIHTDLFFDRFPDRLKDKAPRLWIPEDGNNVWLVDGKSGMTNGVLRSKAKYEPLPGVYDMEARLLDMDAEGMDKELVFPNGVPEFYGYPDTEVREWIFRVYNEHIAEMQALAPGRFYGVGQVLFWDMDRVEQSVAEIKALGIKAVSLPQNPKGAGGQPLDYCLPEMDPLWAAIEAADLPICFHVGEWFRDGPGGHGTTIMVAFGPFRKNFGEFVFGGILDRFPKLQIVFCEADMNWVPGALQTASLGYECYYEMLDPKIEHHPRHYWHNNFYSAFTYDPVGLRLLDILGADRVMWSADYPHVESTYGFGWDALKSVVDATSEEDARAILGGNAMRVFKLD